MDSFGEDKASFYEELHESVRETLQLYYVCRKIGRVRKKVRVSYVKSANRRFDRAYGLRKLAEMTDFEFTRYFRMNRQTFGKLVDLVRPHLSANELQARRSSGSPISVTTKVACALRWLAGGSYLDISNLFGVSSGNFFSSRGVLWQTLDAFDKCLTIAFNVNPQSLHDTAEGFARYSHGRMNHCVMAIDGWVCKTREPSDKEVGNAKHYRNRKNCWAIVVLAGCDSKCRFTFFNANNSGSTNDIVAWNNSRLKAALDENALPTPYYFIGDEAFTNTSQFLVPWSGSNLGMYKDSFNYHLSRMRQCIERAFGQLTGRWGIFWRPLDCQFDKWAHMCTVCAKLHNFCIDNKDEEHSAPRAAEDHQQGDAWVVLENNDPETDSELRGRPSGDTRRDITNYLENNGWLRVIIT